VYDLDLEEEEEFVKPAEEEIWKYNTNTMLKSI